MIIKNIITFIILIVFTYFSYFLAGFYGIMDFILSLTFYTLIFYFFHYLWSKRKKRKSMSFGEFINYFLNRISVLLVVLTIIIGGLAYLLNEVFPAPMPEYTITNGEKTVKFQAMSHIGTSSFYNQVVKNLTNYKKEGGVYFYEGVKPGTDENLIKFNKAIGLQFDNDLYKNFSKLYGVTNQDNNIFMGLVNDSDFNVDLNMDEIVKLYEIKMSAKPQGEREFKNKLPLNANKIILDSLAGLNDNQLKILVYINQAILNFIISSEGTQNFLTDNFANKDLFDVILGERNINLSNEIINSKYDKIYITYGLLHFKGVLKLLQEKDSKWQIITTTNLYPIKD